MPEKLAEVDQLSPSQRALFALKELRAKLDAMERAQTEPIAIIGMGCRFPGGANDPQAFWRLLHDGVDAIIEVPADRWDVEAYYDPNPDTPGKMYTRWGGFLNGVGVFDPQFFGIAPREAESMDPQHMLLLEVSWEALENAGQAPEKLAGSQTGLFLGISNNDYLQLQIKHGGAGNTNVFSGTGSPFCMAVGRLSYVLGLHGPSLAVDTACSSALVAVHLACQSLRNRDCDMAIAAGVNLTLTPETTIHFCKTRMLAADGHCKTFDAAADGYARGEGCGVVVLKRLSDAWANGDNVLAVVRGSAVNHDGRSNGMTAPNGPAQEAVIRKALENARVKPNEVSYVEAHGTGTSMGDPIEVNALGAVLGKDRRQDQPLKIGTVKTNIGSLEAASGMAGLIKVVLSLQNEKIPPHLHLRKLNSNIFLNGIPAVIPTELTPWPAGNGARIAGVSAFGLSGTNAHLVIEEASLDPLLQRGEAGEWVSGNNGDAKNGASSPVHLSIGKSALTERHKHILCLSAKSDAALRELAGRYERYLSGAQSARLEDLCFTANVGRSHFNHRLAAIVESTEQLRDCLTIYAEGNSSAAITAGQAHGHKRSKIAFRFSGSASAYSSAGWKLYNSHRGFRKTIDRCDELARHYLQNSLSSLLSADSATNTASGDTVAGQLTLFALQYALVELWMSWGIKPAVAIGANVGEWVAACVAGTFTLEEGIRLIAERGRLMPPLSENGNMNAHISEMQKITQHIQFAAPQFPILSSATGQTLKKEEISSAKYWSQQLRELHDSRIELSSLRSQGVDAVIEIGAAPALNANHDPALPQGLCSLPSLMPEMDDLDCMLKSLASLYVQGVEVNWAGFDADYPRRRVELPTYPFQREVYYKMKNLAPSEKLDAQCSVLPTKTELIEPALLHARPNLATPYVAPQADLEKSVAGIWETLLGIRDIGAHDNFFELGGNSLLGIEMFAQIEKRYDKRIPPAVLLRTPTIQSLAGVINQIKGGDEKWSSLVPIQPNGDRAPFYLIHPGAGSVLGFYDLPRHLGYDQPFYALQAKGLNGKEKPFKRIEPMATYYLREIQKMQPQGPYLLGGRCFGGIVAFEMAQQLHARGEKVALLVIIDTLVLHNVDVEEMASEEVNSAPALETTEQGVKMPKRRRTREDLQDLYSDILENISRINQKARKKYAPQPYPGRLTLFRNGEAASVPEHQSLWSKLAGGGLDIHVVPGEHKTILLEPHVGELAKKLRACIDVAIEKA